MDESAPRGLTVHLYGSAVDVSLETGFRIAGNARRMLGPDVQIELVVQGGAVTLLAAPEQRAIIDAFIAEGAAGLRACRNSLRGAQVSEDAMPDGVDVVPAAIAHLAERQWAGWAYVRI